MTEKGPSVTSGANNAAQTNKLLTVGHVGLLPKKPRRQHRKKYGTDCRMVIGAYGSGLGELVSACSAHGTGTNARRNSPGSCDSGLPLRRYAQS